MKHLGNTLIVGVNNPAIAAIRTTLESIDSQFDELGYKLSSETAHTDLERVASDAVTTYNAKLPFGSQAKRIMHSVQQEPTGTLRLVLHSAQIDQAALLEDLTNKQLITKLQ